MRIVDCSLEIAKKLDNWLECESIVKHAMFDSTFTKEYLYYVNNESSYREKINDQVKVVILDDVIIAYMVLQYYEYSNIKEVSFNPIVVNPKYHNIGYGKKVLRYVIDNIEEIVKGKVNRLEATISKINDISIKLFTALEFKQTGASDDKTYLYYSLELDQKSRI